MEFCAPELGCWVFEVSQAHKSSLLRLAATTTDGEEALVRACYVAHALAVWSLLVFMFFDVCL